MILPHTPAHPELVGGSSPFTPGQYLTRRRTLAGLGLTQAAASAAAHPACELVANRTGRPDAFHQGRTLARLAAAEEDLAPLTFHEAEGLAHVFAFDPSVYLTLVDLRLAGANSVHAPPRLCRSCACSEFDPCSPTDDPCGWAEAELCSTCAASPRELERAA